MNGNTTHAQIYLYKIEGAEKARNTWNIACSPKITA